MSQETNPGQHLGSARVLRGFDRGFFTILGAQFCSALADNTLLFAAIALLKQLHAPDEYVPILQQFFIFSYIVLAPFVGAFADALPKGRVMLIANNVKLLGCLAMLAGLHPLPAYALVGLGAAMYSPAKYGILTEYLPKERLVLANGWMEGLTVAAIILGAICGGLLLSGQITDWLTQKLPFMDTLSPAQFAILICALLYVLAFLLNLYIPNVALDHKLPKKTLPFLLRDFWHAFKQLWKDPLGQVALAVTTLFWGVGATMRLILIEWADDALKFSLEQATQLTAVVAVGIAIGSAIAARFVKLEKSVKVLPVGIAMGVVVIAMIPVTQLPLAIILLLLAGGLVGFFVVPMNALLQHRGHLLMGAGHSIAVQNFNENIGILVLLGAYALMLKAEFSIYAIVLMFGLFISTAMGMIYRRHRSDVVE